MLLKVEKFLVALLGLSILCICIFIIYSLFITDFAFSVIPGWHTVLYPPKVMLAILLLIILVTVFIVYYTIKLLLNLVRQFKNNSRVFPRTSISMHIALEEKFSKFSQHWHPYIIGELNDNYVKVAKVKGDLVWHKHEHEDEMFVVLSGTLMMDFRDGKTIATKPGEILIVPKNTEHRPWTNDEEVKLMLVEPKATKHTGELVVEQTVTNLKWI